MAMPGAYLRRTGPALWEMASRITVRVRTPRRRFLLAAGAAAAAIAAPRVSRAQTAIWRMQTAWAPRDIFHEFALDFARIVEDLTGGRFKFDVHASGSVVPVLQMQDAVHAGILEASHGTCDVWYRRHNAA